MSETEKDRCIINNIERIELATIVVERLIGVALLALVAYVYFWW